MRWRIWIHNKDVRSLREENRFANRWKHSKTLWENERMLLTKILPTMLSSLSETVSIIWAILNLSSVNSFILDQSTYMYVFIVGQRLKFSSADVFTMKKSLTLYQTTIFSYRYKLWALADNKINVTEKLKLVLKRIENAVGKGKKLWLPSFSPVPSMFSKGVFFKVVKSRDYHTMPHFDALEIYSCGKHCEKRRNCLLQAIYSFFHSVFYPVWY